MHIVVNHLRLRDPLTAETEAALHDGVRRVVDGGGLAAQVVKVDGRHLILILTFVGLEDAERTAREVGGPWMREHIVPLLDGGTERSVGEVVASATR